MDDPGLDLRRYLDRWPYNAGDNVRLVPGGDGRGILLVRRPMGIDQHEADGRPDGRRPWGMESTLDYQLGRVAAFEASSRVARFYLTEAECTELFEEGTLYCHRFGHFLCVRDWARAQRDLDHQSRLLDLVEWYAEGEGDRSMVERWRPALRRMKAALQAALLLEQGRVEEARATAEANFGDLEPMGLRCEIWQALRKGLQLTIEEAGALSENGCAHGASLFMRQGDYWTIGFKGKVVQLRATRGLEYIARLLRDPGREYHVTDLLERPSADSAAVGTGEAAAHWPLGSRGDLNGALDPPAKAAYRRRLAELREEVEEADRLNDPHRASCAQQEMEVIAQEIAAAVGLGGRQRRTGADAERARSAVTKRVRASIARIAEALPGLGRHLGCRIRTGYFLAYRPQPEDGRVRWRV